MTQACRGALAEACVGTKIDASHPAFVVWLDDEPRGPPPARTAAPAAPVTREEMLALRRRKLEAEARKLELANAQREGSLISREFVSHHLFSLIDAGNRRLLGDGASSIAIRLFGISRASGGASLEDFKHEVREQISRQLTRIKGDARRKLDLAATYTNKDKKKRP